MQERELGTMDLEELCPVLFSLPGGWLVIMPRARSMPDEQWEKFDCVAFVNRPDKACVPVEMKQDSFGLLGTRVVAVDYG